MFIGYSMLENWLTVVDRAKPVYANLMIEAGKRGIYSQHSELLVAIVSQPEGDLVHYCRIVLEVLPFIGDSPFGDHKYSHDQASKAWNTIRQWLLDNDLIVREGTIAFPTNLYLTSGFASCLDLEKSQLPQVE